MICIAANGNVYAQENSSYLFSFLGYESMDNLNLGSSFDTSNVTNMRYMFQHTGYEMNSLSLGDKFKMSKVTDMLEMFLETGHNSMITLNFGNFLVEHTDNINMKNIFVDCCRNGTINSIVVKK